MSTDRQYGKVIFICDECGTSEETGEEDFFKALAAAKQDGWRAFNSGEGTWAHCCAKCYYESEEEY